MHRDQDRQPAELLGERVDVRPRMIEGLPSEQVASMLDPRREAIDEQTQHTRPRAVAARPAVARPTLRQLIRRSLSSRSMLRQAIVLQEVLGPPKGLQNQDNV